MYDINYFSVYRKKKGKGSGIKVFLIVFVGLFIVANAALAGIYILTTTGLNAKIQQLEDVINSEDTKAKIAEAEKISKEAALTREYLSLLQSSSDKLAQFDYLDTALLDKVRSLTPAATSYSFAEYNGYVVNLECYSPLITDPMDMYHAFKNDPTFVSVTLTGISVDAQGMTLFSIICQMAPGGVAQ